MKAKNLPPKVVISNHFSYHRLTALDRKSAYSAAYTSTRLGRVGGLGYPLCRKPGAVLHTKIAEMRGQALVRKINSDWYQRKRENEMYRAITGRSGRSNTRAQEFAYEECECGERCECGDR